MQTIKKHEFLDKHNKPQMVEFTQVTFDMFKKCHAKAVRDKHDVFRFKENSFNTDYAKYLIQHLSSRFKG